MAHVRKQLRDAVVALLVAEGGAGARVNTVAIDAPAGAGGFPERRVSCPGSTVTRASTSGESARQIELIVAAYVTADALEDAVDAEAAAIEAAILTDAGLRALCVEIQFIGDELAVDLEGDRPAGRVRMQFAAVIVTAPNDPETQEA